MTSSIVRIKRRLAERAGLDPDLLDRDWFERVLQRRLGELHLDSAGAYCELLDRDTRELQRLVEQVSVTETWFFRYPQSFDLLFRHLKALRSTGKQAARLRMLSVACATGQESYSMAIAAVQAGWPLESVVLDAVDRNEDAIAAANAASYPRRALRDDAPEWAFQWLREEGDRVYVDARIRTVVNWMHGDILQSPSLRLQDCYDVIFCRNLLIYLHRSAREKLVARLSDWLAADGLLFVGHAERIEVLRSRFQFVTDPHTFALRSREPERPAVPRPETRDLGPRADSVAQPVSTVAAIARNGEGGRPFLSPPAHRRPRTVVANHAGSEPDRRRGTSLPVATTPQTATDPTLSEASALADSGDLDEALRTVEAVIENQAPTAEAFGLLGSVQLAKGNLPKAREALVKSLYLDAHREETLLQLALVYQRLGNHTQAARYRRRAEKAHHDGRAEK